MLQNGAIDTFGASPEFSSRTGPTGETKPRRESFPIQPMVLPSANSDFFRFDARLPAVALPVLQRPTYMAPKPKLN
jgi:hypothetical protein